MLQQIRLNFKRLIRKERAMTLLFVVVQLLSVVTIFFSYGIINHFDTKTETSEGITTKYNFEVHNFDEGSAYITANELKAFFDSIIPVLDNKIKAIFSIGFTEDEASVIISFGYDNDEIALSPLLEDTVAPTMISGRLFTEEELQSDAYVAVVGSNLYDGQDFFNLGGHEYKKIGVTEMDAYIDSIFVPYKAMPDNYNNIVYFSISLTKPLLETEYDAMVNLIQQYIGDKVPIPEFDGIRNTSFTRVYNDLIVVTAILIIVCAFNYCIIYRYILEKRKKAFAVSRICGCTRLKAVAMYMIELLAISLATLGIGIFIYLKFLLPKAVDYFEYIEYYHTFVDNIQIAIIYVVSLFVVYLTLVARFVSSTPADLVRGCK